MQGVLSARGAEEFREAFTFEALCPGVPVQVGDITVTPFAVDHTDPTYALVAEAESARLCYTADTAPGAAVRAAATGADLLLSEATLPEEYAGASPHLTSSEAGALARDAGAGRLVLTHVWPTNDRVRMKEVASEVFDGPVDVASELAAFEM
jgi:ribonuclease BN (tRNA processing enzyme)